MAWERLKTDYKDAVWSGLRKFIPIDNGDGSYSVKDVTQYTVYDESFFGAYDANPRIATILVIEANVGLRIGDTLSLRRSSFIKTPSGHAFNIVEHKTGKVRRFKVQEQVYNFLLEYADSEGIEGDDLIFPIGVRAVQKHLKKVCDWLGPEYEDISTHSFRKYFGTEIYYKNGKDIELVRRLYQHSSAAVTARYLGVTDEKIEQALDSHVDIIYRPK